MDSEITLNENTLALARKITEGMASREEKGITLKTLNTQLAVELVNNLDDIREYVELLKSVKSKLTSNCVARLKEHVEMDDLELDDMFKYLTAISNDEFRMIEAYRKLLQGGQLFGEDAMSEEDRIILRVLRSFSTADEKRDFFDVVAKYMAQKNINVQDIEEDGGVG